MTEPATLTMRGVQVGRAGRGCGVAKAAVVRAALGGKRVCVAKWKRGLGQKQ